MSGWDDYDLGPPDPLAAVVEAADAHRDTHAAADLVGGVMVSEDFEATLTEVPPGKYARIPYDAFAVLFPPGVAFGQRARSSLRICSGARVQNREPP